MSTAIVIVLETDRLILRKLAIADASFIQRLVNEPAWVRHIGDKGVRSPDDAREYIVKGPLRSYERFGFGLYLTELRVNETPIGICGLLKRDALADVDLGFALLPEFWGNGYAYEAASAMMVFGTRTLGLSRIVAVTSLDNVSSIKVLEKLGLRFQGMVRLSEDELEIGLFSPHV